jgi:hypothetical protein
VRERRGYERIVDPKQNHFVENNVPLELSPYKKGAL